MAWRPAYVALGSNLSDPRRQVENAFDALAALPDTRLVVRSSLWRSAPLGPQDQPEFVNAAAGLVTTREPRELLASLQAVERRLGTAEPAVRWGPRVIHTDLLATAVGAGTVLEQPMENPFLERFYKDRRAAAFPAQLFFLFQRARQLSELRQHDLFAQVRVADYMLDKDRLFARIVLDDEEFKLYDQVYARLAMDAPAPDLVVFLQAPVDVLLARIDKRGIPYEKYIDAAYLERLGEAYTRYFHQYTASPLLIVNTAEIDPANNSRDFDDLFETIRRTTSGRHYVNALRG